MSTKDETQSRTIGSRSLFDWAFMLAAVTGVWLAAGAFAQINAKLDNKMTRAEFTRWTVRAQNELLRDRMLPIYDGQPLQGDDK